MIVPLCDEEERVLHNDMLRFILFLAVVLLEILLALYWFAYRDQSYYPFAFFLLLVCFFCLYRAYIYLRSGLSRAHKLEASRKYHYGKLRR